MASVRERLRPAGVIGWRDGAAMGTLLIATLLVMWVFGELIPVGRGFGFGDGKTYGRLAMSFPDFIYVDEYRIGRVLPSMLINGVHRLLPGTATVGMTVRLFRLLNVVMLLGSAYLWYLIARQWSLGRPAAWIGFVGLFVNFSNLKFSLYYPTLTDTTAFAVGMLLLYSFLIRNIWLTAAVAAASAFISPPLAAFAVLLLILPRFDTDPPPDPPPKHSAQVGTATAIIAGLLISWRLWHLDARFEGWIVGAGKDVWRDWLWLSIACVALYIGIGARQLTMSVVTAGRQWAHRLFATRTNLYPLLIRLGGVGVAAVIVFTIYRLGAEVTARETDILFDRMIYTSVARPLAFMVGHVAHFGPIVVIAAILWPEIGRQIHRFGPGMVLMFGGILVLGLGSESRTITAVLPFVAAFTALAANRLNWRPWQIGTIAAMSLVVSRVWFPINQGTIEGAPPLEFPAQFYFMNFGPWMSNSAYWVFMGGLAVVVTVVALVIAKTRRIVRPG